MAKVNSCALCLREKDLERSHLIPSFIYRRMNGAPQPISIDIRRGSAIYSNHQIRRTLLCRECENKFGKRERDVSQVVNKIEGSVYSSLTNSEEISGIELVSLSAPELFDGYTWGYFTLSIMWRFSHYEVQPLQLGIYSETIRNFLDTESIPPPRGVYVVTCIMDDRELPSSANSASTPFSQKLVGFHIHTFPFLGFRLQAYIGNKVPKAIQRSCILRNGFDSIFAIPPYDDPILSYMVKSARLAQTKGKLSKE